MTRHPKPDFRHECENDARRAGACPGLAKQASARQPSFPRKRESTFGYRCHLERRHSRESGNPSSGTAVIWSAVIPAKAGIHLRVLLPIGVQIPRAFGLPLCMKITLVGPGLAPAWPTQASALQSYGPVRQGGREILQNPLNNAGMSMKTNGRLSAAHAKVAPAWPTQASALQSYGPVWQ